MSFDAAHGKSGLEREEVAWIKEGRPAITISRKEQAKNRMQLFAKMKLHFTNTSLTQKVSKAQKPERHLTCASYRPIFKQNHPTLDLNFETLSSQV